MSEPTRVLMGEDDIPTHWYNIAADMPNPPSPPLAADGTPTTPEQMGAIFPGPTIEHEMNAERWIAIPGDVREIYKIWRPTPLMRAAIDEALACKDRGESKVILFNLTGHGHFDMASYDRFLAGELENYAYPAEAIAGSLAHLPKVG